MSVFENFLNLKLVEFSFENFDILIKICICENMLGILRMILSSLGDTSFSFFFFLFSFLFFYFFFFGIETRRSAPNLGVTFVGNKQKGVTSVREFFQFIWEFKKLRHGDYLPIGLDNLKHFSFLIQEKILPELRVCLWLAKLQGGLYAWVVM